ncbi:MAG: electron transfer flavoprotein subunit beta/FixA family protein [Rhodospirillaceae bacterium]|jgi:electron transfer flavoprotein beta subunit|nr:electron transfer flavoprotein subunit beta/FixA family protein [Rhodospirillaceae bacterium]
MKVLVAVKPVIDCDVKFLIKEDNSRINFNNLKFIINPFDENAIEEAVRLKEAGKVSEIIVVSIGPSQSKNIIFTALAFGADRGIFIVNEDTKLQPLAIAKLLKIIAIRELPAMIIAGKQSIDDNLGQTGQMLSALLGWSQGTFVSKLIINSTNVEVIREIDNGLETIVLSLPTVITVDLRINKPRYASLSNIIKAKKKPIDILSSIDLCNDISPHLITLKIEELKRHKFGINLANVTELIDKLKIKVI